jgi:hypothetical protein
VVKILCDGRSAGTARLPRAEFFLESQFSELRVDEKPCNAPGYAIPPCLKCKHRREGFHERGRASASTRRSTPVCECGRWREPESWRLNAGSQQTQIAKKDENQLLPIRPDVGADRPTVHTIRGPIEGTVRAPGRWSTLIDHSMAAVVALDVTARSVH